MPEATRMIQSGAPIQFELCPTCSGRRHRNLSTGEVFCRTCNSREAHLKRVARYEPVPISTGAARASVPCGACELGLEGPHNHPAEMPLPVPDLKQMAGDDAPLGAEHTCRACGDPCGPFQWCRPCGRDKFGER